uniref:G_PROTEIN_RECEP_F1_2 domain-containing protein n=1 Tax=Angiostrongylus cantonensis TaxID=6313 RepID=A0A158PCE7_ANGCA
MRLITEAHMDNVQALNVERIESEILTTEFDYSEWLNNARYIHTCTYLHTYELCIVIYTCIFSCVLVVYVEPLLCSVGFLLNCACIAVFLSVSSHGYFRKTSLLFYFISLSTCNALQHLLSIFVIVLPAMEQAICHPSNPWKLRLACIRRSKGAVIVVVGAALALNVIRFWEMEWHADHGGIVSSGLRDDLLYKVIQEGIVYGLIVYGLPICLLLWLNLNIIRLIRGEQLHVQASRRPAEYRTALMTVSGGLVDAHELVWLVDLSNLLMNINALVTPIICFICTRGFKDLFFVIRFAPPKGSIDEKDPNRYFTPMLSAEGGTTLKCSQFTL